MEREREREGGNERRRDIHKYKHKNNPITHGVKFELDYFIPDFMLI